MKETNYINNLENTITNLKKELDDLINKEKLAKEKLVEDEKLSIAYYTCCEKIEKYCEDNNINLNTIITNECIEYLKKDYITQNNQDLKIFRLLNSFFNGYTYKEVIDFHYNSFLSKSCNYGNKTHDLDKHQEKINSLQKELHYANAILEGVNTLKDIKKLLTKNE